MIDFLSLSNDSFGMEISDTAVRLIKLARRREKVVAVAAGFAAIEKDVIKDGDVKNTEKLVLAIKKALVNSVGEKIRTKRVAVSLPENKSFLQVIKMPKMRDRDLRAAVIFEAENYIPLPLEKVYLDFEAVALPQAVPAESGCEVQIAALDRQTADSRVDAVVRAGLMPVAMELESQAVVRALFATKNMDSPTAIIQIGDTRTNIIICYRNSIRFSFSIPVSNNYFLEKIAQNLKVDIETAQNLKVKCGIEDFIRSSIAIKRDNGNVPPKTDDIQINEQQKIFDALIPGLVDFIQQAKKCFQYYQTHESDSAAQNSAIGKILICGSGSNLKALDEFISLKLGLPVSYPTRFIDIKPIETKGSDKLLCQSLCGFSVATGLALREFAKQELIKKEQKIKPVPVPKIKINPRERARIKIN